ncbi:hypothetical protein POF51_26030 [Brevibacillus sp. AG]|uniref:hypothetical protein n=1 Tax=Brevibacillus sp. AG TaxID=3020891 RepID=UPI00232DD2A9|nr:hypothetical protein [Brevibacillus sp. AG]MDC0764183.1 hypothetical protein [Brevibacillus sp. AG]
MEQTLSSVLLDGSTIIIGERIQHDCGPAPALVTLSSTDRSSPFIIGGAAESNIWSNYLLPLIQQDLMKLEKKTSERELSGITLLIQDPNQFEEAKELISSSVYRSVQTWQSDDIPWHLNPLEGTPHQAAAVLLKLISTLSDSTKKLHPLAEEHVLAHTLLLKFLHQFQSIILYLSESNQNERGHNRPVIIDTYHSIFESTQCTIDEWLRMYADPVLVVKATRTLEMLAHYLDQNHPKYSANIGEMRSIVRFMESCYQERTVSRTTLCYVTQQRGTPLLYLQQTQVEKILYPSGHPHEQERVIQDTYSEHLSDVLSTCMFLSTNKAFRNFLIGKDVHPLIEHFNSGGVLLVYINDQWGSDTSRSLLQTLWLATLEQYALHRSNLTDHSIVITEGTSYLYRDYRDGHLLKRGRKRGVFITCGVRDFRLLRNMCSISHFETILASFPNRIIDVSLYDPHLHFFLRSEIDLLEDFEKMHPDLTLKTLSVFRSSISGTKPLLIKGIKHLQ